jgi:hypothetical protein
VDTDGNGLPDWWEQLYFGHLTGTDPNADPDGDGFSNMQEYIADTNPTNSNSFLRMLPARVATNSVTVTWSGGSQARQHLQRASSMNGPITWTTVLTNQPPTLLTNSYVDPVGTNRAVFYRIEADRP